MHYSRLRSRAVFSVSTIPVSVISLFSLLASGCVFLPDREEPEPIWVVESENGGRIASQQAEQQLESNVVATAEAEELVAPAVDLGDVEADGTLIKNVQGQVKPETINSGALEQQAFDSTVATSVTAADLESATQTEIFSIPLPPEQVRPVEEDTFRYVVKKGDTLWDIANKFLLDPWLWPEFWLRNGQVENPHLIYPGDIITLYWRGDGPVLELARNKLSPRIRTSPLGDAVDVVPLKAIRAYLNGPRFIGQEEFEQAPYIVAIESERLIAGNDMTVYARRFDPTLGEQFIVLHPGKVYRDPVTREPLGYEAIHVADAALVTSGEPATLMVINALRESRAGDRLLPKPPTEFQDDFYPQRAPAETEGVILAAFDDVLLVGEYWIVTINLGSNHGIEQGHVLGVQRSGRTVRDPITREKVALPDRRIGVGMVFRVSDRYSHILVMDALEDIRAGDRVTAP